MRIIVAWLLPAKLRELSIMAIGTLNQADHEWAQHEQELVESLSDGRRSVGTRFERASCSQPSQDGRRLDLPMHVASIGRNDPCPCGSKKKYKKCCLSAADAARTAEDADMASIVNRAIAHDDWQGVNDVLDPMLEMLEPGSPFEYLRFLDDQVSTGRPTDAELARWASGPWLKWCEQELTAELTDAELDADQRTGIRMAIHLVRRFGARSPVVEHIADLQAAERLVRDDRFGAALEKHGLTFEAVRDGVSDLPGWIESERPAVLAFPDWFVLRSAREDRQQLLWKSGISGRVFDSCMEELDAKPESDVRRWLQLAAVALLQQSPTLGGHLSWLTPPRCIPPNEPQLAAALVADKRDGDEFRLFPDIQEDRLELGDFFGAALLRDAVRHARDAVRARRTSRSTSS